MEIDIAKCQVEDKEYFKNKLLNVLKSDEAKQLLDNDELDKFLKLINRPFNQYCSLNDTVVIYHEMRPPENKKQELTMSKNKIMKWWSSDRRRNRIKEKILERANVCLYDTSTGKKYQTTLNIADDVFDPCSGKKINKYKRVWVEVSKEECFITVMTIKRNGYISPTYARDLKKNKNGKYYLTW